MNRNGNAANPVRFRTPDPRRDWPIDWAPVFQTGQTSLILVSRSKFGSLVITGARLACNQDDGVQFPGDPPIVAVAESGFRRLAVNQSYVGSNPTGHPF